MKKILNKFLRKTFGVQLSRVSPPPIPNQAIVYNTQNLLYEKDDFFNHLYDEGMQITGTPVGDPTKYFTKRRVRFYNTIQFFLQAQNLKGGNVECGCYKGLSSYIMCNYLKKQNKNFEGNDFIIIDSFEGLSDPSAKDALGTDESGKQKFFVGGGYFATPMEQVKDALKQFPSIYYLKGWIPEILGKLPEQKYKFVHIDLDFYDPIKGALEYFYQRLTTGGIIVVDDYGSLYWPGAQKAVEEFCSENDITFLNISTAQAIIWKK